jgi:chitinase
MPNTQQAFSNMVSSAENRQTFIVSLVNFMQAYGFDGVDIDWEYPGAPDRGGIPADSANFVNLLQDMRTFFGTTYGISATIPSSYWYLQWFDLTGMEPYLDWFNFMSYDIHGVWDGTDEFTGPYVRPHTNLTEIDEGLQLLWRNSIDPSKVSMGLGWYGRSFTLADPTCTTPGCVFSAGGTPGPCTATSGILSNAEINSVIAEYDLTPSMDTDAAIKWITWNENQWVSYDDGQTIQIKLAYANEHCLGGTL